MHDITVTAGVEKILVTEWEAELREQLDCKNHSKRGDESVIEGAVRKCWINEGENYGVADKDVGDMAEEMCAGAHDTADGFFIALGDWFV